MKLMQIDKMSNLVTLPSAEFLGLNELAKNNYANDMKEMWSPVVVGTGVNSVSHVFVHTNKVSKMESQPVQMATWARGCLYNAETITAYKIGNDWYGQVPIHNTDWFLPLD
jgi:hypothetical protein